jgi:hypothetical protein
MKRLSSRYLHGDKGSIFVEPAILVCRSRMHVLTLVHRVHDHRALNNTCGIVSWTCRLLGKFLQGSFLCVLELNLLQYWPCLACTVKPVYSDHARSWTSLVVMDSLSLYMIQVNYIGKTQGGRWEQVVANTGNRYIQVVAKTGLTVLYTIWECCRCGG